MRRGSHHGHSRWAGAVGTAGLAAAGLLHALWTFSTWPLASRADFARVVVGVAEPDLPPAPATAGVALLLFAAAYLVAARSGLAPAAGPWWTHRTGVWVVATVLLLRGAGGLVVSASGFATVPNDDYARWDTWLYSPLCLALGAAALRVAAGDETFPRPQALRVWAGRILVFIGLLHLAVWMSWAQQHLSGWVSGELWSQGPPADVELRQADAYFWATLGSAAPPGLLLGLTVSWLGRRGHQVPTFLGWGLIAWPLVATAIFPTPMLLIAVPGAMIVAAARTPKAGRPRIVEVRQAASFRTFDQGPFAR